MMRSTSTSSANIHCVCHWSCKQICIVNSGSGLLLSKGYVLITISCEWTSEVKEGKGLSTTNTHTHNKQADLQCQNQMKTENKQQQV